MNSNIIDWEQVEKDLAELQGFDYTEETTEESDLV